MLDLKFIRENPDLVKNAVKNKNEKADIDKLLVMDEKWRQLIKETEKLKRLRNQVSAEINQLKKQKKQAAEKIAEMRKVSEKIKILDEKLRNTQKAIYDILIWVPNIPHPSVPVGPDESFNQEIKRWGEIEKLDFKPKTHWELGTELGLLDLERGSKLSGSNFIVFKGMGAHLERALINFFLDYHTQKQGYKEIAPPFIVRREDMFGTGQIPKLEDDMYHIEQDDLFLIPTAEVPLTNLHKDEILKGEDLPLCYTAYPPCFRREAGSYGRDTRGLIRIHQFAKVEMVKFVKPETSWDEHEKL
ncbi:MAG TPA: serine--tRNA ligase, partial [Bacteroidetes bacterium]|nr:serine--tRNA ligase [Bacteroidota bacterium]